MRSAQAVKYSEKVRALPVSKKALAKKTAKVLVLPLNRTRKQKELTDAQRQDLVLEHREKARKMAMSILRRWHARLEMDEIESTVDVSLCEAVRNFNPSMGASFITFMFYHLKGNLVRAVTSSASANGIPMVNYESVETDIDTSEHSHSFSSTELAEALSTKDALLPDEIVYRQEMINLSLKACDKLDDLEKEVVKSVLLGEEQVLDVATRLGYSRCHISRVKKKALGVLFSELKGAGWQDNNVRELIESMQNEEKSASRRRAAHRGQRQRRPVLEIRSGRIEETSFAQAAC